METMSGRSRAAGGNRSPTRRSEIGAVADGMRAAGFEPATLAL
jgi:hypothetical protein